MKIAVGISGGVDSAVAALILKQQGHDVRGVYMHNWDDDDPDAVCTSLQDAKSALAVCEHLGIPLETVNFSRTYWERVFDEFLAEHRAGRTPNPDVLCNKEIKFKAFLEHALGAGAEAIATGHYARVENTAATTRLLKGIDTNKDQTYFLYAVAPQALARTLFPVGHLTKPQVRAIARDAGLPNYDRSDSTGICFIGERNYRQFVSRYLPAQPGDIRSIEGEYKGRHDGLMYYTLGQRQGIGLGGPGEAWYVVEKDIPSNTLIVAQGPDHGALYHDCLIADDVHWICMPRAGAKLAAKTRYRQVEQACEVGSLPEGRLRVRFSEPQRALTPGQAVVFYEADECLGGARIVSVETTRARAWLAAAGC